jgi:hypothetical protein
MTHLDDPGTLHAYPEKARIGLYGMMAGIITLLSLWGIVALLRVDDLGLGERLFGIALLSSPAFFLGKLTLMYIKRLSRQGPEITVDAVGLTAVSHADKTMEWDNIHRAEISALAKNIICLWLVDPSLDPSRRTVSWLTRRARRLHDMGDVVIGVEAMTATPLDVLAAIRSHLPTFAPRPSLRIAPPPRR